jgi:hypothetical protein
MAETLGMLCDKLTVVKLKQYHSTDQKKLISLEKQASLLQSEIDTYLSDALNGKIPFDILTFDSNKVFNEKTNKTADISGNIAEVIAKLAEVNCLVWHEQEKAYEFEKVPLEEKDKVVKNLAVLNLERNKCIDRINLLFKEMIEKK